MIHLVGKPKSDCPKCASSGYELQQNRASENVVLQLRICACITFEVKEEK